MELPIGDINVSMRFEKNKSPKKGAGGVVRLYLNDNPIGEGRIPHTNPNIYWPSSEGMTCGVDNLSPVSKAYNPPFEFTGTIKKVTVIVKELE